MPVKLHVVGIFFEASVIIPEQIAPIPVSMVMQNAMTFARDGAYQNVTDFAYSIDGAGCASAFTASYAKPFISKGGFEYQAGTYYLPQDLNGSPIETVWQYYVADANGQSRSFGRKPFTDPSVTVQDGGSVTWRLVSILKGPNAPSPRAARTFAR